MNMMRMLRKHMNKLLILLVILIAIAFGVSYTMQQVITSWLSGSAWARMFGREVGYGEFQSARNRLAAMQPDREKKVTDDDVWEYLVMLEESRRTGMVLSERELQDAILTRYREMRISDEIRKSSKDQMEFYQKLWAYQRLTELQKKAKREAIPFNAAQYSRLISERYRMSVPDYEQTYREVLLMNKLLRFVRDLALASSKSVYGKFVEEDHQRRVDYLHLDSENYTGKVEAKEEELKKLYEERKAIYYKEPARIAFEYVMARFDDMKALLPAATEQELKAFYNRNKNTFFKRRQPGVGEVVPPEEMYKPFEEVREDVEYLLNRDRSEKKARELTEKVCNKVNTLEEIELLKAAELAAEDGLRAGETKPFSKLDYPEKLVDEFGYCEQAPRMFDGAGKIGGRFKGPHTCDKGVFYYRLSKHQAELSKPFAEVREEVEKYYINQQAGEAAQKDSKRIIEAARKAGGFTNKLIAKEELTRITTDFFKTYVNQGEIGTIKGGGREVVEAAFGIEKVGDLADPVMVDVAGKSHYYLVQYKSRREPGPTEFLRKRQGLIGEEKSENGVDVFKEWKEDLMRRANIEKLYLEGKEEEKPEGEAEKAAPEEGQEEKSGQEEPKKEAAEKQPEEKAEPKPEGEKE